MHPVHPPHTAKATHSNAALVGLFQEALERAGLPADACQLVSTRGEVASLLELDQYIDLVIPRGGKALVQHIKRSTRIPVLGHADGICSVFLDTEADRKVTHTGTRPGHRPTSAHTAFIHR